MTIVIHDAAIATVDDQDTLHYGAAIAIDGDRIAAIGPSAEILARYPAAEKDRRHAARWSCRASPTCTRISP